MNQERATQAINTIPCTNPLVSGVLQRKCACGNHTMAGEECAECQNKKQILQRKSHSSRGGADVIPSIVHEVLHSPGQPLDTGSSAFFESRYGHDFSNVRVHTNAKAAESAQAVNAYAYTVGRNIIFGAHQFAPHSSTGRQLLAHELAHVMQQGQQATNDAPTRISEPSEPGELHAEQLATSALTGRQCTLQAPAPSPRTLSRRVIPRLVNCTANTDGAPADPVAVLTTIVDRAEGMARATAILLTINAALIRAGIRPIGSTVDQAFEDRFGVPPAVRGGFMNRLTGAVRPSLEIALSEEMNLMARRYELIASQFGAGFINYICMSTTASFGGCSITDCSNDAWACPGVGAVFLCPGFWGGDLRTSSTLLIHETSHMIWARVGHGARGSGGNFRHAECYASLVADIFGLPAGGPACPVI